MDAVDPLVRTLGYEAGWRGNFSETLNTSIAIWNLEIDSELIYAGDEGIMEYAYTRARFDEAMDGSRLIPGALKQVLTTGINWQFTNDALLPRVRTTHCQILCRMVILGNQSFRFIMWDLTSLLNP